MMDLNKIVNDAISEINKDFELELKNTIKEKVQYAIKDSIDSAFRWGDLSKSIKDHVNKELGFDTDKIKLHDYKAFILEQVNNSLAKLVKEENSQKILENVYSQAIGESRKEIEFQTFFNELHEIIKEKFSDDPCNCGGEEVYLYSEMDTGRYCSDSWVIGLRRKRSPLFSSDSLGLEIITQAHFSKDGTIYHVRTDDSYDYGDISGWFTALKFLQTKITDISEEECSYPDYDH